jgi:hypothetical protein
VPDSVRNELFQAWQSIQGSAQALDDALQQEIFDKPELCRTAQTLIKSWYTGQWGNDALQTISGETYKEGLIWRAINAHPQGAKQQGFGTWSYPPNYLEDRS